jgi:hypothetical protein
MLEELRAAFGPQFSNAPPCARNTGATSRLSMCRPGRRGVCANTQDVQRLLQIAARYAVPVIPLAPAHHWKGTCWRCKAVSAWTWGA